MNDPVTHVLHVVAPSEEYFVSLPHAWQPATPAALAVPTMHVPTELVPSQERPTAHVVHPVRVSFVPPAVNEAATHVEHAVAPTALHLLSAPQAVHVEAPATLN